MKLKEPTTLKALLAASADHGGTFAVPERIQMKPLKSALTLEDQVGRLKNVHALEIGDSQRAIDILSRVNYYRLSAYGIGLKRPDNPEKYQPGISLEHLYRLYLFDSYLRNMLFRRIEQVEIELRTQIAYHLSLKYGPEGYMDPANFNRVTNSSQKNLHRQVVDSFKREVEQHPLLPCVAHHNEHYGGHFPLWAAVELFSFGTLSSLFTVMRSEDQKAVGNFYGKLPGAYLKSWMASLVDVRNRCAHYGRIYNMNLVNTPKLFKEHKPYRSDKIFPVILILHRMMQGRQAQKSFCDELCVLLEAYPEARLDFMGFPEEWKDLLGAP